MPPILLNVHVHHTNNDTNIQTHRHVIKLDNDLQRQIWMEGDKIGYTWRTQTIKTQY